jgi:hypothetical protein
MASSTAGFAAGDFQVAVAVDEFEDFADRGLVVLGLEADAPGHEGGFGIQVFQGRQGAVVQRRLDRTQAVQLAQQQRRLVGLAVQVRLRTDRHRPDVGGDLVGVGGLRLDRDGLRHEDEAEVVVVHAVVSADDDGSGSSYSGAISSTTGADGGGRGVRVGPGFQLGGHGGRGPHVDIAQAAGGADVVGQDVGGAQQDGGQIDRVGHGARAHGVQQGLEHVGEAHQRLEAEGAGAALDRVDGAENGVDGLAGRRRLPA